MDLLNQRNISAADIASRKLDRSINMKALQSFLLIGGIPFLAFGIFAFTNISFWGKQREQRKAAVDSGSVFPIEASINKKWTSRSRRTTNYNLAIEISENRDLIFREVSSSVWNAFSVGQALKVYFFDGDYFIPATDLGGHNRGKWVFLTLGCSPVFFGLVIAIIRHSKKSNHFMDPTR